MKEEKQHKVMIEIKFVNPKSERNVLFQSSIQSRYFQKLEESKRKRTIEKTNLFRHSTQLLGNWPLST